MLTLPSNLLLDCGSSILVHWQEVQWWAVTPDAATSVELIVSRHHCLRQLLRAPIHQTVTHLCGHAQHSRSSSCPSGGLKSGRCSWQAFLGGIPETLHLLVCTSCWACNPASFHAKSVCRHCTLQSGMQAVILGTERTLVFACRAYMAGRPLDSSSCTPWRSRATARTLSMRLWWALQRGGMSVSPCAMTAADSGAGAPVPTPQISPVQHEAGQSSWVSSIAGKTLCARGTVHSASLWVVDLPGF